MSPDAMIEVDGVSVEIDGARLLHDVHLRVDAGEWVGVLGPNGAGKSTLVRTLAGACPHTGRIRLADRDAAGFRARERALRVAVVPQTPIIPAGIAVRDYLLLGRNPHVPRFGIEGPDDHAAVDAVLDRLGLTGFRNRRLDSLSGGERQRVVLGRALAQDTSILVLDEPTSALDIGHQQEVLDLVDELRLERGLTVLSTMHDLTLAGQYADRLVMLAHGRVIADGTAREVLDPDLLRATFSVNVRVIHDVDGLSVLPIRGGNRTGPVDPDRLRTR